MTKYRTIVDCDEVVVITEDGGVACIRENIGDDYITTIDYYQDRITQEGIDTQSVWNDLGIGKMYCDDFTTPYTDPKHIQTALEWLVWSEAEFEVDETIWEGF